MFWRISWSLERYLRNILPTLVKPERILEFGPGRSTRVMAETFPQAEIVSLEHQEPFYQRHLQKLADLPKVTVYHCPLDENFFYRAAEWTEGSYDLILVDGPPKKMKPQVRGGASCVFDNLTPGGLVILDDSNRPDEKAIISRWIKEFDLTLLHSGSSFTVLQKGKTVHALKEEALEPVLQAS